MRDAMLIVPLDESARARRIQIEPGSKGQELRLQMSKECGVTVSEIVRSIARPPA